MFGSEVDGKHLRAVDPCLAGKVVNSGTAGQVLLSSSFQLEEWHNRLNTLNISKTFIIYSNY
jgi:hypothetical protein